MYFLGIVFIALGGWLVDSGIESRHPISTLEGIIEVGPAGAKQVMAATKNSLGTITPVDLHSMFDSIAKNVAKGAANAQGINTKTGHENEVTKSGGNPFSNAIKGIGGFWGGASTSTRDLLHGDVSGSLNDAGTGIDNLVGGVANGFHPMSDLGGLVSDLNPSGW